MIPVEVLQDGIFERAIDLSALEKNVQKRILKHLNSLQTELQRELLDEDLTEFRKRRLQSLLKQTRETIGSTYNNIENDLRSYLYDLAENEAKFAVNLLNNAVQIPLISVAWTPQFLQSIVDDVHIEGNSLFNYTRKDGTPGWWQRQSSVTQNRVADAIRQSLLQGETIQESVQRIRGKKGKDGKFHGGVIEASKREADALARTAIHAVTNDVRKNVYEANSDVVQAVESLATLDKRTTVLCRSYEGLRWTVPDFKPIGHDKVGKIHPPRHFRCRSVLLPVIVGIEELDAKAQSMGMEIPHQVRASMDGSVPASTDMKTWLNKKTADQQNEMLGVGRAQLWRDGKVTLQDLTDKHGNELTLEQLRNKYGQGTGETDWKAKPPAPSFKYDYPPEIQELIREGQKIDAEIGKIVDRPSDRTLANLLSDPTVSRVELKRAVYKYREALLPKAKTSGLKLSGNDAELVRQVEEVALRFPPSWNKISAQQGYELVVEQATDDRGGYGVISGGQRSLQIIPNRPWKIAHELAHHYQELLPEVNRWCQQFHAARTKNHRLERLAELYPNANYRDDEFSKPDYYPDSYFGKENTLGQSEELLTMMIEYLFMNYRKMNSFRQGHSELFVFLCAIIRRRT